MTEILNDSNIKEHVLSAKNVSMEYYSGSSQVVALKNVSLNVEKEELLTILGPSGCGKSTLLNILAGYIRPTSGFVSMHGELIEGPSYKRGKVFQSPTLYPWLSIKDNISFGLRMRHEKKYVIEEQTMSVIEATGLEGFEERFPYELSGGMQQRAAVARVLVNKPEVMLMDEPFGALDPQTRSTMQELLLKLHKKMRGTIVLVTHDIKEALYLGSRTIVMKKRPGEIIFRGKAPIDESKIVSLLLS